MKVLIILVCLKMINKVYQNVAKILDSDFNELKTFYHDDEKYHQEKQVTNYGEQTVTKFQLGERQPSMSQRRRPRLL